MEACVYTHPIRSRLAIPLVTESHNTHISRSRDNRPFRLLVEHCLPSRQHELLDQLLCILDLHPLVLSHSHNLRNYIIIISLNQALLSSLHNHYIITSGNTPSHRKTIGEWKNGSGTAHITMVMYRKSTVVSAKLHQKCRKMIFNMGAPSISHSAHYMLLYGIL